MRREDYQIRRPANGAPAFEPAADVGFSGSQEPDAGLTAACAALAESVPGSSLWAWLPAFSALAFS